MKRATVSSIRAHLVTASIAAMTIDAMAFIAIDVFGIRESAFETPGFRLTVVVLIAMALALTRLLAFAAYRRALAQPRAFILTEGVVHSHYGFRQRSLVLLHLRFSGVNAERCAENGVLI